MGAIRLLLALHIAGGGIALLAGPAAMLSRKGGRAHRTAGRVFALSMGVGALCAFALSLADGSRLLLTISVLTGFLIACGLRAIRFRHGASPVWADRAIPFLLAGFSLWLFWLSAHSATGALDPTGLFFGAGGLWLAWRQWRLYGVSRPDWLVVHLTRMGGAYVATATAFIVVNFTMLPEPLVFIGPTLVGSACIARAASRHARPDARLHKA